VAVVARRRSSAMPARVRAVRPAVVAVRRRGRVTVVVMRARRWRGLGTGWLLRGAGSLSVVGRGVVRVSQPGRLLVVRGYFAGF
jgi:hypothetical protein